MGDENSKWREPSVWRRLDGKRGPLVPLLVILVPLGVTTATGERLGMRTSPRRRGPIMVDAAAGGLIGVVATLVVVWLLLGMVASVSAPVPLAAVHRSRLVNRLGAYRPPQPALSFHRR